MLNEFLTRGLRRHSRAHHDELEERGYRALQQLFLDSPLIRNSPWKTYWRVLDAEGVPGFVKVNYGYESADLNRTMGFKEAMLPKHLASERPTGSNVLFPEVLDHWQSDGGYFVVSRWQDLQRISLQQCLTNPRWFELFLDLLGVLRSTKRPNWWSDRLELHNFSLRRLGPVKVSDGAFFGFDLDDNMSLTPSGALFVNDFEFFQWDRRGLQETYASLKVLCSSRRETLEALASDSKARRLIRTALGEPSFHSIVEQAARAWRAKLQRNSVYKLGDAIRLRLASALLHTLRTRL